MKFRSESDVRRSKGRDRNNDTFKGYISQTHYIFDCSGKRNLKLQILRNWISMTINNYWMRLSMISWIIKTEVCVICRSRRLRQIIQTRGFDNSWNHTKTEFNNCFIIHFLNNRQKKTLSVEKWLYFKTKVKLTLISLTKII